MMSDYYIVVFARRFVEPWEWSKFAVGASIVCSPQTPQNRGRVVAPSLAGVIHR